MSFSPTPSATERGLAHEESTPFRAVACDCHRGDRAFRCPHGHEHRGRLAARPAQQRGDGAARGERRRQARRSKNGVDYYESREPLLRGRFAVGQIPAGPGGPGRPRRSSWTCRPRRTGRSWSTVGARASQTAASSRSPAASRSLQSRLPGRYILNFGSAVTGKLILVSNGRAGPDTYISRYADGRPMWRWNRGEYLRSRRTTRTTSSSIPPLRTTSLPKIIRSMSL